MFAQELTDRRSDILPALAGAAIRCIYVFSATADRAGNSAKALAD